ncbi:hypothetical protein WJX74_004232 [Apatococcus lobatus]|uniref:DNA endonuclease activator Ctp1 C-terminal domain-containing protein n=1 Tax=Apatococcus lobatus TaxID=904363 RepID=A0AAW1RTU9_9CHLO
MSSSTDKLDQLEKAQQQPSMGNAASCDQLAVSLAGLVPSAAVEAGGSNDQALELLRRLLLSCQGILQQQQETLTQVRREREHFKGLFGKTRKQAREWQAAYLKRKSLAKGPLDGGCPAFWLMSSLSAEQGSIGRIARSAPKSSARAAAHLQGAGHPLMENSEHAMPMHSNAEPAASGQSGAAMESPRRPTPAPASPMHDCSRATSFQQLLGERPLASRLGSQSVSIQDQQQHRHHAERPEESPCCSQQVINDTSHQLQRSQRVQPDHAAICQHAQHQAGQSLNEQLPSGNGALPMQHEQCCKGAAVITSAPQENAEPVYQAQHSAPVNIQRTDADKQAKHDSAGQIPSPCIKQAESMMASAGPFQNSPVMGRAIAAFIAQFSGPGSGTALGAPTQQSPQAATAAAVQLEGADMQPLADTKRQDINPDSCQNRMAPSAPCQGSAEARMTITDTDDESHQSFEPQQLQPGTTLEQLASANGMQCLQHPILAGPLQGFCDSDAAEASAQNVHQQSTPVQQAPSSSDVGRCPTSLTHQFPHMDGLQGCDAARDLHDSPQPDHRPAGFAQANCSPAIAALAADLSHQNAGTNHEPADACSNPKQEEGAAQALTNLSIEGHDSFANSQHQSATAEGAAISANGSRSESHQQPTGASAGLCEGGKETGANEGLEPYFALESQATRMDTLEMNLEPADQHKQLLQDRCSPDQLANGVPSLPSASQRHNQGLTSSNQQLSIPDMDNLLVAEPSEQVACRSNPQPISQSTPERLQQIADPLDLLPGQGAFLCKGTHPDGTHPDKLLNDRPRSAGAASAAHMGKDESPISQMLSKRTSLPAALEARARAAPMQRKPRRTSGPLKISRAGADKPGKKGGGWKKRQRVPLVDCALDGSPLKAKPRRSASPHGLAQQLGEDLQKPFESANGDVKPCTAKHVPLVSGVFEGKAITVSPLPAAGTTSSGAEGKKCNVHSLRLSAQSQEQPTGPEQPLPKLIKQLPEQPPGGELRLNADSAAIDNDAIASESDQPDLNLHHKHQLIERPRSAGTLQQRADGSGPKSRDVKHASHDNACFPAAGLGSPLLERQPCSSTDAATGRLDQQMCQHSRRSSPQSNARPHSLSYHAQDIQANCIDTLQAAKGVHLGGSHAALQPSAQQRPHNRRLVPAAEASEPNAPQKEDQRQPQPHHGSGPGYKYKETVRKRADREALPGFDCPDCRGFYEAMASWGHLKISQLPSCGHAPPGRATPANEGQSLTRRQIQDAASRHRAQHRAPETPAGFWDMGFEDSLDSRVHK